MDHAQPQVLLEAVEVAVVMQQLVPFRDAEGGDQAVDGLANRDPTTLQRAKVLSCSTARFGGHRSKTGNVRNVLAVSRKWRSWRMPCKTSQRIRLVSPTCSRSSASLSQIVSGVIFPFSASIHTRTIDDHHAACAFSEFDTL